MMLLDGMVGVPLDLKTVWFYAILMALIVSLRVYDWIKTWWSEHGGA